MRNVQVGANVVEFPDTMSDEQIGRAIRGQRGDQERADILKPGRDPALAERTRQDPLDAFIGRHVIANAPYAAMAPTGLSLPAMVARVLGAFPAGMAFAPYANPASASGEAVLGASGPAKGRVAEGVKATLSQAGAEVLGPITALAPRRVGSRGLTQLSDQLADKLVTAAKDLVPWWKDLPKGQQGLQALVEDEGMAVLKRRFGEAQKSLSGPKLAEAKRQYAEGINFLNTLKATKAMDPASKRLDPETFIKGLAVARGKNPQTVWDLFLTEGKAPRAREAIRDIIPQGMRAPEEIPFPGLSWILGHRAGRVSERAPFPLGYRHIPGTETERRAREILPFLLGGGLRETASEVRPKEE